LNKAFFLHFQALVRMSMEAISAFATRAMCPMKRARSVWMPMSAPTTSCVSLAARTCWAATGATVHRALSITGCGTSVSVS
jgi:hypothetical protein